MIGTIGRDLDADNGAAGNMVNACNKLLSSVPADLAAAPSDEDFNKPSSTQQNLLKRALTSSDTHLVIK